MQEVLTSSSRIIELDKPIKKDIVDLESARQKAIPLDPLMSIVCAGLVAELGIIMAGAHGLIPTVLEPYAMGGGALLVEAILAPALATAALNTDRYYGRKIVKQESLQTLQDEELHFRADRLVYKGQTPLQLGSEQFKKGTNFYHISLPISINSESGEFGAQLDLYSYALKQIRDAIADKDYGFVAIDTQIYTGSLIPGEKVAIETLLKRERTEINASQHKVATLTRDEFEYLTISPQELFLKATQAFDDKLFSELVWLGQNSLSEKESARIKQLMVRRLDAVLTREIEARFNSLPETFIDRGAGHNHIPVRSKAYMQGAIKKTGDNLFFVQTNTSNGEIHWVPLNKLLQTQFRPIESIIQSTSSLQKPQLAYILHQMVIEAPFEELMRKRALTREEVMASIEQAGFDQHMIGNPKEYVRNKSQKNKFIAKFRTVLGGVLLAASFESAALGGVMTLEKTGIINQPEATQTIVSSATEQIENNGQIQFPENVPAAGLVWKIDGTMLGSGYFVTGTSHQFSDGHWEMNNDIAKRLELPESVKLGSDSQYLILSKAQLLDVVGETDIRIPVRENSKIVALKITDSGGASIPFDSFLLTDGSIDVKMSGGIMGNSSLANIEATFVPSSQSQTHATQRMSGIDKSGLSSKVQGIISKAQALGPANVAENIFTQVRDNHVYSIDPPDEDKLDSITTPDDAVNVMADLSEGDCETNNTEAVIAVNAADNSDVINIAYGFHNDDTNLGGSINYDFLRSETMHAFALDQSGDIFDATSTTAAADQATQQYLNLLKNPAAGLNSWSQIQQTVDNEANTQQMFADLLKDTALVLGGAGGIFALSQLAEILRRRNSQLHTPEQIQADTINRFVRASGKLDLQNAYNFFGWLSYGKTEYRIPNSREIATSDKTTIMKSIMDSVSYDKLAMYAKDPKPLERIARERGFMLSNGDFTRLRSLADYLSRG